MRINQVRMPRVEFDTIGFAGGWDQSTPILALKDGYVRDASNFEVAETIGYRRIAGYERFDGRPRPSDATYSRIYVTSFVNTPTVGDTITGSVSGATGVVIGVGPDYMAYTKATGVFDVGNDVIMVGATTIGTSTTPTGGISAKLSAIYTAAAADEYRKDITAVPGSGPVIGCFLYNDIVYAFRANATNTAVDIWKSSASGWVNVPLYMEVGFNTGSVAAPADGATLVQGGVSATIKRVVRESGAWTGDAAGRFIITTPTGGSFTTGTAVIGSTTVNLTGTETQITIAPSTSAKLEVDFGNFFGGSTTYRVYGCDGVNRMFEFDGDVYVPIETKATPDAPKHIEIHAGYLMCSIGSSLLFSAPGDPYDFSALSGAGEIGTGHDITGLKTLSGDQSTAAMLVTSNWINGTSILYGTGASTFQLKTFDGGGGAIDYTVQKLDDTYMFDSRGVAGLTATLNYGNFVPSTLTKNINQFVESKHNLVSCSTVERRKGQYRIFFTDKTALYVTIINGQFRGCMPILFDHHVHNVFEGNYNDGTDASFMCTTDGYVMQMEKGTSFDGNIISAHITPKYSSSRSHRILKDYMRCSLEIFGGSYVAVSFGYSLGYKTIHISQPGEREYEAEINAMQWDNFTWDAFTWDGGSEEPIECEMTGTAENVKMTFRASSNYMREFTLNSATIHYIKRRAMR